MSENTSSTTSNTEKDILKARDLIRDGNLSKAKELLQNLLDAGTSSGETNHYAKLQLANAYLYLQNYKDAITLVDALVIQAKEERDALLTIVALVTKGDAIIDMVTFGTDSPDGTDSNNNTEVYEIQAAIEAFGKALGVSEFFNDEKMTILPLVGLAHAHWLWGNPKKAVELCERVQKRAEIVEGPEGEILKARAALSHAITQQSPDTFQKAIEQASLANHISLKQRIERFYNFYKSNLL